MASLCDPDGVVTISDEIGGLSDGFSRTFLTRLCDHLDLGGDIDVSLATGDRVSGIV